MMQKEENVDDCSYHLTGTFTRYSSRLTCLSVLSVDVVIPYWNTGWFISISLMMYINELKIYAHTNIIHFPRLDSSSCDVVGIFPDPVRCEFCKAIRCMLSGVAIHYQT